MIYYCTFIRRYILYFCICSVLFIVSCYSGSTVQTFERPTVYISRHVQTQKKKQLPQVNTQRAYENRVQPVEKRRVQPAYDKNLRRIYYSDDKPIHDIIITAEKKRIVALSKTVETAQAISLGVLNNNGTVSPYLSPEWNEYKPNGSSDTQLINVAALYRSGEFLWVLDNAYLRGSYVAVSDGIKVLKIHTKTARVETVYRLNSETVNEKSYVNDFVVDAVQNIMYLYDKNNRRMIVYAMSTDTQWVIFYNDYSLLTPYGTENFTNNSYVFCNVQKYTALQMRLNQKLGKLYYSPICSNTIFSIDTKFISNYSIRYDAIRGLVKEATLWNFFTVWAHDEMNSNNWYVFDTESMSISQYSIVSDDTLEYKYIYQNLRLSFVSRLYYDNGDNNLYIVAPYSSVPNADGIVIPGNSVYMLNI